MVELLNDKNFMWIVMAVLVLCLSQLLKLPIKALTKKFIKNDRARGLVNLTIMLLPLGLGVLCDFLYCSLYIKVAFNIVEGLKVGGTAITLYGALEKIFKGSKSSGTLATEELVNEITKDGKVDENDTSAVKEFWNKVK